MANSAGLRQTALAQDTADRVCIMLLIIHRLLSSASVPRSCHITRTGLDIKSPNQIKSLASDARTYFVSAGSAGVSLPPRLCTWLPGLRSSARVTPQRTSTTALFDYISVGRSTHCVLPLATVPFQRLLHRSGTVCRSRSGRLCRCKFSAAD